MNKIQEIHAFQITYSAASAVPGSVPMGKRGRSRSVSTQRLEISATSAGKTKKRI
jgi:hypothetical protein